MPYIDHTFRFNCIRCHRSEQNCIKDEQYQDGSVDINDVIPSFGHNGYLDFTGIKGRNSAVCGGINPPTGDLCDNCLHSLMDWLKDG